jgi:hypothetical protein
MIMSNEGNAREINLMLTLVMLNLAPAERNPTVNRWDSEAKLRVNAIEVGQGSLPVHHTYEFGDS